MSQKFWNRLHVPWSPKHSGRVSRCLSATVVVKSSTRYTILLHFEWLLQSGRIGELKPLEGCWKGFGRLGRSRGTFSSAEGAWWSQNTPRCCITTLNRFSEKTWKTWKHFNGYREMCSVFVAAPANSAATTRTCSGTGFFTSTTPHFNKI